MVHYTAQSLVKSTATILAGMTIVFFRVTIDSSFPIYHAHHTRQQPNLEIGGVICAVH